MKVSEILYEKGEYWVKKAKHGYEVYKTGLTVSTRCAQIGWEGGRGFQKAKEEIDRRLTQNQNY